MQDYLLYILPALTAFAISLLFGPIVIKLMVKLKFGQQVRDDGPQSHLAKQNTPTVGGLIMAIVLALCAVIYGFSDITLIACLISLAYGLVGFLDDIIKIIKKRSLGLRAYQKIIGQFGIAVIAAIFAYNNEFIGSEVYLPLSNTTVDLGVFYIPVAVFVIIAIVNATNLTDGLDGLASGVVSVVVFTFGAVIAVLSAKAFADGNAEYSQKLQMLVQLCSVVLGAALGFLRFNVYPARIFMGDTGSLLLGGALAAIALFSKLMLFVPIAGGVLVASCVSVILQVGSYKLRKKRIFKMAPLHHHFELCGYHETKVTAMYVIVTVILCFCTMMLVRF